MIHVWPDVGRDEEGFILKCNVIISVNNSSVNTAKHGMPDIYTVKWHVIYIHAFCRLQHAYVCSI